MICWYFCHEKGKTLSPTFEMTIINKDTFTKVHMSNMQSAEILVRSRPGLTA